MGLFRKEEKTKFRTDSGKPLKKPIRLEKRNGWHPKDAGGVDELLKQQKSEKSGLVGKAWSGYKERRKAERKMYKEEFQKSREQALRKRARSMGRRSAQPRSYNISGNYNPFGGLFDTGMNYGTKKGKRKRGKSSWDMFDNYGFFK